MEIRDDLTNEQYRVCEGLSSSDLKLLLDNPYKYKMNIKYKESTAFNLGKLVHCLILEPQNLERDFYILANGVKNTKTKNPKAEGKTIITQADLDKAYNCVNAFKNTMIFKSLFNEKKGRAELSFFDTLEFGGSKYKVKCRTDFYLEKEKIILDLKTTSLTAGASAEVFVKNVANYAYYLQAFWYLQVTQAKDFYFIVLELNDPYMVGVYKLSQSDLDFARDEAIRALNIYDNLEKYKDRVYLDNKNDFSMIQTLTLPNYVYYKNSN